MALIGWSPPSIAGEIASMTICSYGRLVRLAEGARALITLACSPFMAVVVRASGAAGSAIIVSHSFFELKQKRARRAVAGCGPASSGRPEARGVSVRRQSPRLREAKARRLADRPESADWATTRDDDLVRDIDEVVRHHGHVLKRDSWSSLLRDSALAVRLWRRRPALAVVALATLALGIGAPTAMFSILYAVLLRPLPYLDPDRVVRFRLEAAGPRGAASFDALPVDMALRWGQTGNTLAGLAIFNDRALTLSSPNGPFRLTGISSTPNLFELLATRPAVGRTFAAGDRDERQVVLSYATWTRFFNADRAVVGTSIMLDGQPYFVTGVMPDSFRFPTADAAFWTPIVVDAGAERGMMLPAIARLRPGVAPAAAEAEGERFLEASGNGPVATHLHAPSLQEEMVGGESRMLWMLMAAVTIVFVVATVNIALLLVTMGAGRERELSVRLALGAGRGRLLRQLAAEGLALAVCGGLAGLGVAEIALKMAVAAAPADLPRLQEAALDAHVLLFTLAMTAFASVCFAVLSAGRAMSVDPIRALAGSGEESRLVPVASPRRRLNVLAASELALTMVLLVGAGLLLRSFVALVLVDQGFASASAVAMQVTMPLSRYPGPQARLAFAERLLTALRAVKGADSVGLAMAMPNRQPTGQFAFDPLGKPVVLEPFSVKVAPVRMVTDGLLEAMGVRLLSGRTFQTGDVAGSEPVVVISESLARQHFPNGDPIGKTLYSGAADYRVVGVVGDVKPAVTGPQIGPAAAYLPFAQQADVLQWLGTISIVARGRDPKNLTQAIRTTVLGLDPEMPTFNVRTLEDEVAGLTAGPRFSATLVAMLAAVALVMAAIGVYGVVSHMTAVRTKEIGVRVALGATRADVLRLVMRDGLLVIGAGLVVGLTSAVLLARTLTGLLYQVRPADPVALLSVGALLSAVGLVAAWLPARRAARVSALTALRTESLTRGRLARYRARLKALGAGCPAAGGGPERVRIRVLRGRSRGTTAARPRITIAISDVTTNAAAARPGVSTRRGAPTMRWMRSRSVPDAAATTRRQSGAGAPNAARASSRIDSARA